MSDENQTFIPASFIELYLPPGQLKPRMARAEMAGRYELCEDLAQMLTETAAALLQGQQGAETDVLQRCLAGLNGDDAVVSGPEARWVVHRLAELLNWPPLAEQP